MLPSGSMLNSHTQHKGISEGKCRGKMHILEKMHRNMSMNFHVDSSGDAGADADAGEDFSVFLN